MFPAVVALMKGSEESLKRECAFVLANPWSLNVGVTYEAGMLLLQEKLVEVGAGVQRGRAPRARCCHDSCANAQRAPGQLVVGSGQGYAACCCILHSTQWPHPWQGGEAGRDPCSLHLAKLAPSETLLLRGGLAHLTHAPHP